MKADLLPFWLRWRHQLPNGIEYYLKLAIVLLLQFFQFPRKFSIRCNHLTQPNESSQPERLPLLPAYCLGHLRP